jgi:hypothetical protein
MRRELARLSKYTFFCTYGEAVQRGILQSKISSMAQENINKKGYGILPYPFLF